MEKNARPFGHDLMRGEHVVGAPKHSKDLRPDDPNARLAIRTDSDPYREAAARQTASLQGGTTFNLTAHPYDASADTTPTAGQTGTSIFDPVLTELAYRWFCPPGGIVLDPFAGGSVRGIVASRLDRYYVGCELRQEQVSANRAQATKICAGFKAPIWHQGDSAKIIPHLDLAADFVFSCPPYGDLEIYSDQPDDLSAMPHEKFVDVYRDIIAKACAKLRDDRFACFVVGDFRDKAGHYRDFVSTTIKAFRDAGLALYNEVILVTATSSLPIRAGQQFEATRKLGKALRNGTPVLTPDGWVAVESLNKGGLVIAADGAPTEIMGVYPQGRRDLLTVTFEDGAEIDVDHDHLWEISARGADRAVMTTAAILERWGSVPVDPRPMIPYCAPVRFPTKPTPVHPYLVGLLLGDGGLTGTTPIFTSSDVELVEALPALMPAAMEVKSRGYDHRLVGAGARSLQNPLTAELRALGMMGHGAATKRVPDVYLWNDVAARLEVYRGLMDSDGTINRSGSSGVTEFSSISRGLCEDVAFLARSLGARASVHIANRASGISYRTRISGGPNPFALRRKAEIWDSWNQKRTRAHMRRIKSIAPAAPGEATCIAVAHSRALFVAHDFIVTHNTHQNVLVFLKGDARRATKACGPVKIDPAFFAGADAEAEGDADDDESEPAPAARAPARAKAPPFSDRPRQPEPDDNTPDLTPIERHGDVWLKRDDLWAIAGVAGGKVRTCWALAQAVKDRPGAGLVTAGSRASPQVNIVAHIAARLGVGCRAHTPTGKLSPEVAAAQRAGAEIIQHKAGYNNVIVARARDDAAALGWVEIPFGMECDEAVRQTSAQIAPLPDGVKRLVVPVGSGMSLAGILTGLARASIDVPVLGVVVGADPIKRLDRYAPPHWRDLAKLVPAGVDYHEAVAVDVGGVLLDPHYEAKCARFLEPGDMLWLVGIRATA